MRKIGNGIQTASGYPCVVWCLLWVALPALSAADDDSAFFENRVRPLLVKHCVKCHGAKKSEGNLRLDSRAAALSGGERGPAIVPSQPEASLLVGALGYDGDLKMPPAGKLPEREIAAIVRWVRAGAAWPSDGVTAKEGLQLRSGPITDAQRAFWSFQPIADPPPPEIDTPAWAKNEIDRFVLKRLQTAGLQPVRAADKPVLLRRATLDLIGLPPTPEELQAFLADESDEALGRVVDRLLRSPQYGERWGRHWLDVVRYADTAGETADYPVREAFRYRNWVIDALNADQPYPDFIRDQLAGDVLAERMLAERADPSQPLSPAEQQQFQRMMTATGFIAMSRRFGFDSENYHHLTIQDTIDTIGQAVLGLTLGCARCHDHKFDPVNKEDYYAWYGIFQSSKYSFPGSEEKKRPYDLVPLLPAPQAQLAKQAFDTQLAGWNTEIAELQAEQKKLKEAQGAGAGGAGAAPADRLAAITARLGDIVPLRDAAKKRGPYPVIYGVREGTPVDAKIQVRGERDRFGETVARRNLEILGGEGLPPGATGSGRQELAEWLVSPNNPLTARVMVNRIWQQHFGVGLVGTENDFGTRGLPPTHPELLDWLASRFQASGWSIKAMHRLIMQSATYQLSSDYDEAAWQADPRAALRWRFSRRRLTAEELRDGLLAISGRLDPSRGGEHPFPDVESWGFTQHNPFYGNYDTNRRSVYLMQQRLKRHPFLGLFDGADPNVSTARRTITTVPTQALYLMNSPLVHDQSQALARRVLDAFSTDVERLQFAYQLTLARSPSVDEVESGRRILSVFRQKLEGTDVPPADFEAASWAGLARTLFVRNEFLFVD